MEYVGRKVKKNFEGYGVFLGTVKSYDESRGFFGVVYDDGDFEEMDLAEITSVLVDGDQVQQEEEEQSGSTEITRKSSGLGSLGRGVGGKSRKRRRVEKKTPTASGNDNNCGELNEGFENGQLGLNEELVNNVSENRLDLDLNDEVTGLDLNKDVDFNVKEEEGLQIRAKLIDLNVDVNENDSFENEMSRKDILLGTEKKDRGFDLNLGLEDEIRTSDAECDVQLKDCIVQDVQQGEGNCGIETLQSGVYPGNAGEETPLRHQNGGFVNSDVNDANLFDVGLTGPSTEAGSAEVDGENGNVGSVGKGGRGRKRKKVVDGTATTMETSLRRSSRRARRAVLSVQDHVTNGLDTVDDSPAVSGVSEEKVMTLGREESEKQEVLPPKVELPPSSECLNLESMPVLDVFSVYAFLRSFSMSLFLSPFELEDFVASVTCNDPNLLFDSIHVSLLQTLRKHLESLSNDSSGSGCDCLRSLNWDLLDLITWPIFMIEYLVMHSTGMQTGFDLHSLHLSGSDYYKQPARVKIEVLRCLCDDVMEVEAIRSELNRRTQGTELNVDFDRNMKFNTVKKRKAAGDFAGGSCLTEEEVDEATDCNSDECCLCRMDGSLICCDGCPAAFHARCVGVATSLLPEGDWYCPECLIDKNKPWLKVGNSIRGGELLGTDPYDRLYYSCCGYLLVLNSWSTESPLKYYHRNDLPAVIQALKSSAVHYNNILTAISAHLHISSPDVGLENDKDSRPPSATSESLSEGQKPTLCALPLVPTGTCAVDEIANLAKLDETMDHPVKMEIRLASSEGLDDECHAVNRTQTASGLDCANKFSGILDGFEIPSKICNVRNCALKSTNLEVEQGKNISSAAPAPSSSEINTRSIMVQGHDRASYVNCYDFARTASLIFEELTQKSSDKKSENAIGSVEEIISAQLKVISSHFSEFCWPNIFNENVDARKETCGWCFACKFPEVERDCFFVMNDKGPALESYTGEMLGVRTTKNRKGHFVDVMCHILRTEDRLQGLLSGPWLNPHYSKLWRKSILRSSNISALKNLLLTLESNLRHLALSGDWLKPIDAVPTIGSACYVMTSNQRLPLKQGTGKKKGRSAEAETNPSSHAKGGQGIFWWRGGRLSRELFRCKVLPNSLARKAARRAGCTKIPDLVYPENLECARRSKCIAWRAAVETSSSVEQLALQVRELDANIRWDDIGNTNILKKVDKETKKSFRSFKKVIIRRKSLEGAVVKYLLDFGKRRFIPDVVVKHGTSVEDSFSERKRYWLEETHVPLHLLKSFEEKRIARKSNKMSSGRLEGSRRMMKKPFKKKGFSYLFSKVERSENYQCGHCNKDILNREAVSCLYCKGFFHKRHVRKSAGSSAAECTYACHKCQDGATRRPDTKRKSVSCKSQKAGKVVPSLPSKTKKQPSSSKTRKPSGRVKQPLKSQDTQKRQHVIPLRRSARQAKSVMLQNKKSRGRKKGKQKNSGKLTPKKPKKSVWKKKRTQLYYSYWLNGLKFSRKPNDEKVINFSSKNLIMLSGEAAALVDHPKCDLCGEQEFSLMLNYIACEICGDWFHADAFDLRAESIGNVIGFKCHKCRVRNPPVCPHLHSLKRGKLKLVNSNNDQEVEGSNEESNDQPLFNQGSEDQKSQLKEESMDLTLSSANDEKQALETVANLKPALELEIESGRKINCSEQETTGSDHLMEVTESTQEFVVSEVNDTSL